MTSFIPDAPLLAAGGLGGPFVMLLVTPCRNALTFGSQDQVSTIKEIYSKQVFARGIPKGWTGGIYPAIAACPQFLCLGPAYHIFKNNGLGVVGGVVACSALETAIVYGAETKNAQLATNAKAGKDIIPKVHRAYVPYGPGVLLHISRNIIATSGIRIFNVPINNALDKVNNGRVNKGVVDFVGDFGANVLGSALSMPIHMLYNFTVCTPELWTMKPSDKKTAMVDYLKKQYIRDGKISPLLMRDLGLRILYLAQAYTLYATIEKSLVAYWP